MRAKRGFTVTELLVALAIIVILGSIAVPFAISSSASAKARELNSAAEELFLYAQNRLTHIEERGTVPELESSLMHKSTGGCGYLICEDGFGILPKELVFDLGGKSALAEIDTYRGDVLAVFYSEDMAPEELEALYLSKETFSRDELNKLSVGYFGIDERSTLEPFGGCAPQISVMNREDLWLEITFDGIPSPGPEGYEVRISLSGPLGSVEKTAEYVFADSGTLKAYYLVDSMTSGGGSLYAETLAPLTGTDGRLTAQAKLYFDGRPLTSQRASELSSAEFSPFFEDDGGVIKLSKLRHLSNLRQLDGAAGRSVLQTADIGFGESFRQPEEFFPFLLSSGAASIAPIPEFSGSYNGADHFIYDLRIDGGTASGLFALADGEIKDLHILSSADVGSYVIPSEGAYAAGTLCGIAGESSRLVNCSVSGVKISCEKSSDEVCIGGLAGILRGSAVRCSSSADICARDAGGNVFAGGLAGRLGGGRIERSHTAGRIETDSIGASAVGGIAADGSGTVADCYSECMAGYIGGAEYCGVCPSGISAERSYFVVENAWLDRESAGALTFAELETTEIEGFSRSAFYGGSAKELPESVSVNGTPTRFADAVIADPRGLFGIAEIKYSGGEFSGSALCCFDAYENDRDMFPPVEWEAPEDGETRLFLFESLYSSGERSFVSDGENVSLGEGFVSGRFFCREILGVSGKVTFTLGFNEAVRTAVAEKEESKITAGAIAIVHNNGGIILDPETWLPVEAPETYDYYYSYITPDSDMPLTHEDRKIEAFEKLTFGSNTDGEIRIYAFSDSPLGEGWSFLPYDESRDYEAAELDGIYYYELARGTDIGEFTAEIRCGSSAAGIRFRREYDWGLGKTVIRVFAQMQ